MKHKPIGPFSPPLPKDAEATDGGEPFAVANDKASTHGESFAGTSASRDQWDDAVARKFGRRVDLPKSDEETRRQQSPEGYSKPDENGWARLDDDE